MSSAPLSRPPEWASQRCVWAGWPRLEEEWGGAFAMAKLEIAGFIRALSSYVPVKVAAGSDAAGDEAYRELGQAAEIIRVPTGDIWLRDTGPLFGRGEGEALNAAAFAFNGWGGKYLMDGDTETADAIAGQEHAGLHRHDFVLEGGAIDMDGEGLLLTTRQCLLNPNRNSGWDEERAEAALKQAFDIERVIWLGDGLKGDHTDGHIDNLARFVGAGHVVCQTPSDADDPNAEIYEETRATLEAAGLKVTAIPSPGLITGDDGAPVPASHMNFVITNGAVFLPVYENEHAQGAQEALAALFPKRDVLALPARHILEGGGSFHCMTQDVPDIGVTKS